MPKRLSFAFSLVAALVAPAFAQDGRGTATIYGILDAGVETARTSGGPAAARQTSIASGSNAASRIGFLVREVLGGGMYAGARLEHGLEVDTGANTSATKFWNRASYVSLGGGWGELRIGREYTPAFFVLQQGDINGLNLYGNAGTFAQLGPNNFTRTDNGINYISPSLANVTVRVTYSIGDETAPPLQEAGRVLAASAIFDNKTVVAGAFHQVRRDVFPANSQTIDRTRFSGAAARFNAASYSIGTGVARWDPAGPNTATAGEFRSWWLGAGMKFGVGEVRLQGGKLRSDTLAAVKPSATLYSLSYLHSLSQRTTLYATYGKMTNNAAANFRLEASSRTVAPPVANGLDTGALTIGMTHRF